MNHPGVNVKSPTRYIVFLYIKAPGYTSSIVLTFDHQVKEAMRRGNIRVIPLSVFLRSDMGMTNEEVY